MFYDWRDYAWLVAGLGLIVGLLSLLAWGLVSDAQHEDALMQQCMQDHKEYECVAMMRKHETDVVPMPVYISSGRR